MASAIGVTVFSEEEFERAFKKCDRDGSGYISVDEVEEMLFECYGFPPLEQEVKLFMDAFDLNKDGRVTLDEFKSVLIHIKETCKKDTKKACEYTSHLKMKEDRFKHKRM